MHYSTILFDLDGTLTDPKLGITRSVQYALAKLGIAEDDLDKLEPFIGPPLAGSFKDIYAFSDSKSVQAVEYYREYFREKGMYENEIYAGIRPLLEALVNQGCVLMVATSKPTVFAEKIVSHFEIASYFRAVCGSNLDGTRSDKTEIIEHLIQEYTLEKPATVMIGDRKHDIIGAHNAGIASIGVGYGYGSESELAAIKPTYCVRTVQELAAMLT